MIYAIADPLIVLGAPPCTVFSSMQNINQKHHGTPEWQTRYAEGLALLQFSVEVYWDQISRGKFFLHEHPATASSWDLPSIRELAEHPGVIIVTGDMCFCWCVGECIYLKKVATKEQTLSLNGFQSVLVKTALVADHSLCRRLVV